MINMQICFPLTLTISTEQLTTSIYIIEDTLRQSKLSHKSIKEMISKQCMELCQPHIISLLLYWFNFARSLEKQSLDFSIFFAGLMLLHRNFFPCLFGHLQLPIISFKSTLPLFFFFSKQINKERESPCQRRRGLGVRTQEREALAFAWQTITSNHKRNEQMWIMSINILKSSVLYYLEEYEYFNR